MAKFMRLLIYGGTEYASRCRVGEWGIATEILSEVYGIPEKGDWAIGLGILEGKGFLILKRQQAGTGGRTYPLVILYDPGEDTWQKFGWNAAKLAAALLDDKNVFMPDLYNRPESFTAEKVAQMTQRLPEISVSASAKSQNPVAGLIAGTFFESEPLSVNPKSLGISLPDKTGLAAQLEAAPPFLRTGKGWLVGGHLNQAKALGVSLVFDNLLNVDDGRAASVIENGHRLISDWLAIENDAEFSETLQNYTQASPWNFEKKYGQDLSDFLNRIAKLADLLKREEISDEEFFDLQEITGGAFSLELNSLAMRLSFSGKIQYSEKLTRFFLNNLKGESLSKNLSAKSVNQKAYGEWLVESRTFPSESPIQVNLRPDECLSVCQKLIEAEKDNHKIPGLLIKSLEELNRCGGEGFSESLAIAAFQKTLTDWHDIWLNYRDEKFFNDYLKTTSRDRARYESIRQMIDWQNTYLRYGDDGGGEWLVGKIGLPRTKRLFNQLKGMLEMNPSVTKSGTKWLAAIALSPLRERLSFEEKSGISILNNELAKSWRNFNILKSLLEGRAEENIQPAPKEEIEYLKTELEEKLQNERQIIVSEETEAQLKKLIGKFPDKVNEIIGARRSAARRQQQEAVAEKATQAKESKRQAAGFFTNINEFIDETQKASESRKILARNVHYLLARGVHTQALAADFWHSKTFPWKDIYPLLPLGLRAEILRLLLAMSSSETIGGLHKLYKPSGGELKQTEFSRALWETVLTSEVGAEIIQKLKQQRLGIKHPLEEKLREFLKQSETQWELVKEESEAGESKDAAEAVEDKAVEDEADKYESAADEGTVEKDAIEKDVVEESVDTNEDKSSVNESQRENATFLPEKKGVREKIGDVLNWFQNKE